MNLVSFFRRVFVTSFLAATCLFAFAQEQMVSGVVKDAAGEPLIGVNVATGDRGTVTDLNGAYSLSVAADGQLVFSYIGYLSQTIAINGRSVINVTMEEDVRELEAVVKIGYGTVRKRDLTGAVASISAKQIATIPVPNVAQALQGKMAGVNVITQDGRPDASISIRVRGGGSISQSNEPLVLIDGVPGTLSDVPSDQVESVDVLKDAASTAIYGARGANGVVLVTTKGAKSGKTLVSYNGYAKFNQPTKYLETLSPYDYVSYVWANADANGINYVDSFTKLFGIGAYGDIERYRNVEAYDVQKKVYNSSFSHNHDLTVSGGTDLTKIILGVNYNDEQGMKINSFHKRASVSLKVDQKINEKMDLGLDTRYVDITSMSDEGTTSGSGSILSYAFRFRPIATGDILGDLNALNEGAVEQYGKFCLWDRYDPYNRIRDYEPLRKRQTLRTIGSFNWELFKGLDYHTDLTLQRSWNQNKFWGGPVRNNYIDDATGEVLYAGAATLYKADSWSYRWSNTLNYEIEINKANQLSVLLGQEVSNSGGNGMTITADFFPANYTKENAFAMINQYDKAASTNQSPFSSSFSTPSRLLSYFTRMNYSLLDRYLFAFTFRADGSSKFSPNHRWGYFPAGALGWRLSEESFLKDKDWLDNLKLRASYGSVGNDGISADLWSQNWTAETDDRWYYSIDGVAQPSYDLASSQMANPDLKWETTITRNAGIDFGVFGNRLTGTLDFYWNTTKDLLMNTVLPGITSFSSTFANIGQTSNKGVEFSLNGVLFENNDWNVEAGFNINFNRNKVDELANAQELIDGKGLYYGTGWFSSGYPGNDFGLYEGKPVGLVRGLVYEGMYSLDDFDYNTAEGLYYLKDGVPDISPNITGVMHGIATPTGQNAYPGMAKYSDTDGSGMVDGEDFVIIGDMNAKHTGGFHITAQYKQFDLGLYFNWSYGNQVYNVNRMASLMGYKESGVYQNKLVVLASSYKIYDIVNGQLVRYNTPEELAALNKNAEYPLCYNESGVVSSLGIEDGSYLRLNTLNFGYTLPKSVSTKLKINNMRLFFTAYNLLTLTKYQGLDPEVNTNERVNHAVYPTPGLDWGTYPRPRSLVVGANISF
jgi:TonB-linked SusC/RagA family outer membrane protein